MAVSLLVRATHVAYVPVFGLTSLYRLSMAALFFIFGMLVFEVPRLKERPFLPPHSGRLCWHWR